MTSEPYSTAIRTAAAEVHARGWVPVPIREGGKKPAVAGWTTATFDTEAEALASLDVTDRHGEPVPITGLGVALGKPSNGLVDIDLDHPKARRAAALILPPTDMQHGRPSSRWSHRWYQVTGEIPDTRRWANADGEVTVEFRSTGGQTLIPPSRWFPRAGGDGQPENYRWEGEPFGGTAGPALIEGKALYARAATLALVATLLEVWPVRGSRHDAYLALVGGLVRTREGVHPLWATVAEQVVSVIAEATQDEEGASARVHESVDSTIAKIHAGRPASGWPTLSGIIGEQAVDVTQRIARDIEHALGWSSRADPVAINTDVAGDDYHVEEVETDDDATRSPLEERSSTWEPVDLDPYIAGDIEMPIAGVLHRSDGQGLFYPGRVNLLYAKRESGKSWVTLAVASERMREGERVVFVDLEDEPDSTVARLLALGVPPKLISRNFVYLHPEEPLTAMTPERFGERITSERRAAADRALAQTLAEVKPTLVIVDGMTVLYALHGLSTNDSVETDRVSSWLKALTCRGTAAVILVDHVAKGATRNADPIGSQHKMAMVSGAAYHAWPTAPLRIGAVGEIDLIVGKDRIGTIRKESTQQDPQVAATLRFTSSDDGKRMALEVRSPVPSMHIDLDDEAIASAVEANRDDVRIAALWVLAQDGCENVSVWRRSIEGIGPKDKPSKPSQALTDSLRAMGLVDVFKEGGSLTPVLSAKGRGWLAERHNDYAEEIADEVYGD